MKRVLGIVVTLASLLVAPAACGGGDGGANDDTASGAARTASENASATATAASTPKKRRGKTVKVMNSRFGRILVDGRGHTLYLFTRDQRKSRSRCYGGCADAWPPFYTKGTPRAGAGAQSSRLGTTKRRNRRLQVTYNGHPLYYYVDEDEPGEILCQNVEEFGGLWLVVSPPGNAIR
jgi:predicted lipoprotein with Yx(FWY)xxD motif